MTSPRHPELTHVCRLRHGDRTCAVGALIPDGRYVPEMEDWMFGKVETLIDPGLHLGFLLRDLRNAHDTSSVLMGKAADAFWKHWRRAVVDLACRHDLDAESALVGCPAGEVVPS